MFSKWRKGRSGGEDSGEGDERPGRSGPLTIADLGDALVEISESVAAPEDALEPALQAVVEASGAAAGALCLYDVRQCVLRLAVDVGLSDEGCSHLQTVRRGDPTCWDMPLHGLLNRRAYLIESAARNRYVPRLLPKNRPVSTVICIPLYEHITPLASLVLVSTAPRVFGQHDITALWTPLREFGRMIDRIRRQAMDGEPMAAPFREQIVLQQRSLAAERDRLLHEIANHRAERERLAAALEEQVSRNAALRTEAEDARAERDALRTDLQRGGTAVAELVPLRESLAAAERERKRLTAELATARAARTDLRPLHESLAAAEREREKLAAELAAARAEHGQVGSLRESLAAAERERERLAAELTAARAERTDQRPLRESLAAAERERERLTAELAAARAEHGQVGSLRESLAAAERERERLATALASGESEHAERVREVRLELEVEAAAVRERADAAQTRVEGLARELAASQDRAAQLEQAAADARTERATMEATLEALRAEHAGVVAQVAELDATLAALRGERDEAIGRLVTLEERPAATVEMAAEPLPEVAAPAPEEDASVTVISVPPEDDALPADTSGRPVIVVLDHGTCWNAMEVADHTLYTIAPDAAAAAAVTGLNPERVLVNLTAQGAVNTLGALRKAGCSARFWGCIATAGTGRGLALSAVEPLIPPLEPDTLLRKLGDYVCRGARILTVGGDVDALMSLRQALARKGVSVSMAWDAKQSIEVMHQVRPDALVVDLDLPKGDGYAIAVSAAALLDPVPYLVLVGGRINSGEGFSEALAGLKEGAERMLNAAPLLQALATRIETPPHEQEDRRKGKAVGYGKWGRRAAKR